MYATIDIETTGLNRFEDQITVIGVGIAEDIDSPLRTKIFDFSIEGDDLKFLQICRNLKSIVLN